MPYLAKVAKPHSDACPRPRRLTLVSLPPLLPFLSSGAIAGLVLACLPAAAQTVGAPTTGAPGAAASALTLVTTQGKLPDGTPYRIDVPAHWNGAVLIGLDYAGRDPMAEGDANLANRKLLELGYAMAGTTRTVSGWAIQQAAANAIRTLDIFTAQHGKPKYAIQFGSSQGGHAAAVGIQAYPRRWNGAVIQCGGLSGTVGQWQGKFDALFVARTLLAPDADRPTAALPTASLPTASLPAASLPIIHLPADFRTTAMPAWHQLLDQAQQTPQGRARIALAARMGQLPDWSDSSLPQPAPADTAARQQGLFHSLAYQRNLLDQALSSRSQIEALSGGNISGNTGVDYARLYRDIDQDGFIAGLYRAAGLDLKADLDALARAPRVAADPAALAYVASGVFDGNLQVPVLTLNGIGDPISVVAAQQSYEATVTAAGRQAWLRQTYTASAGHCGFLPSESVAAVGALMRRLDSGNWGDTGAAAMNQAAAGVQAGAPRFIDLAPARFTRPYGSCALHAALAETRVAPLVTPDQQLPACRP